MRIKKSILFSLFILASSLVFSQTYDRPPNLPSYDFKKWHFGFTVGPEFQNTYIKNTGVESFTKFYPKVNKTDIISHYSEIEPLYPGFHVGIITSRRLGEYFNLRMTPTLSLGQKTIISNAFVNGSRDDENALNNLTDSASITSKIRSTYISCPIMIKYKAVRINDMRPYVLAGLNIKYDLSTDDDLPLSLKPLDVGLELGLGSDFYLQSFRFGVEVRFGIGLLNVHQTNRTAHIKYPFLTSSIEQVKAKTLTIALNFE